MKTTSETKEEKSEKTESNDLSHFKDQFEELSIKDLRLIKDMVNTTMDLKTAEARHKGKFAKKEKGKNGLSYPESSQYRDVDEDYI